MRPKMRSNMENMLMNTLLVLVGIVCPAVAMHKNCLFHKGRCVEFCPVDMHPYHTRCDAETMSQRTCTFPELYVLGFTCGWSRCDCNGDLVLSDDQNNPGCMPLTECKQGNYRAPGVRKKRRRGKKWDLSDKSMEEMHRGLDPVHYMADMPTHTAFEPVLTSDQKDITVKRRRSIFEFYSVSLR